MVQRTWTNAMTTNRLTSFRIRLMLVCAEKRRPKVSEKSEEVLSTHESSEVRPRTVVMPPSGYSQQPENLRKSRCEMQRLCVAFSSDDDWLTRLLAATISE